MEIGVGACHAEILVTLAMAAGCGRIGFDAPVFDASSSDASPLGCAGTRGPVVAPLDPQLVAYWSFDEGVFPPSDLTAIGDVVEGVGRAGVGARFGGTDGRLDAVLADLAGSHTAMAWFKTAGNGAMQSILDREPENDPRSPVHVWIDDTQITTNIRSSTSMDFGGSAPATLTDDCWHHVVVVREGADNTAGAVRLYVDAVKVLDVTGTFGTTTDTADPFRIGFRLVRDPRPFLGTIDEVAVYKRALGDAEIAEIYRALR